MRAGSMITFHTVDTAASLPAAGTVSVPRLYKAADTGALTLMAPGFAGVTLFASGANQAAVVAAVAGATPAGGVGAAAGGFDTSGNRDTFITTVTEIKTKLNSLIANLKTAGVLASA